MDIKVRPIRSEEDYEAVLAEIDELMDAEPGTSEGDRLDVLVTLVEAYEARHWEIDLPDPVEAIRVRMEAHDPSACQGSRPRRGCPHSGTTEDPSAASCRP
jgi:HTH-type transcriptional regulator / antitoxin HigA